MNIHKFFNEMAHEDPSYDLTCPRCSNDSLEESVSGGMVNYTCRECGFRYSKESDVKVEEKSYDNLSIMPAKPYDVDILETVEGHGFVIAVSGNADIQERAELSDVFPDTQEDFWEKSYKDVETCEDNVMDWMQENIGGINDLEREGDRYVGRIVPSSDDWDIRISEMIEHHENLSTESGSFYDHVNKDELFEGTSEIGNFIDVTVEFFIL